MRRLRRAYVYVAVLATTAIVSLVALCAIQIARVQLRSASEGDDWQAARQLAQGGIEQALAILNTDSGWRNRYQFNTEYPSPATNVFGGAMTWKLTDLGGGNISVDGIGRKGQAACVLRADVQIPGSSPLAVALLGNTGVTVQSSSEQLTLQGGAVATHGVLTNFGTLVGNCEAKSFVGNSPAGSLVRPGPIRTIPEDDYVMSYYLGEGRDITTAVANASYRVQKVVLSPFNNPYGSRDSEGIYIVTLPAGQSLTIEDVRIVGTLVVRNAQAGVRVLGEVNWEPAYPNYPALLVDGPLSISITGNDLVESEQLVNFNPLSTPWQSDTDSSMNDAYPSCLAGLIYSSGNVTLDGQNSNLAMKFDGVLLSQGSLAIVNTARVTFKYDNNHRQNPPPGFTNFSTPRIQTDSWRQVPSY